MHHTGKIRHPTQSLISFWRSNCRQQPVARGNIGNVGENGRHLRDRAVSCGHKCRDQTERIDGEIGRINLPAPLDARGLIGKTTVLQRDVRSQGARSGNIESASWPPNFSVVGAGVAGAVLENVWLSVNRQDDRAFIRLRFVEQAERRRTYSPARQIPS